MRFIYADESGISVNEPVVVVAGVIINADLRWENVEKQIDHRFNHRKSTDGERMVSALNGRRQTVDAKAIEAWPKLVRCKVCQ